MSSQGGSFFRERVPPLGQHGAVVRVFLPTPSDKEFTEAKIEAEPRLRAAAAGNVAALGEAAAADEGPITALMVASRAGRAEPRPSGSSDSYAGGGRRGEGR